jgi:hypothetical protein
MFNSKTPARRISMGVAGHPPCGGRLLDRLEGLDDRVVNLNEKIDQRIASRRMPSKGGIDFKDQDA